MAEEKTVSWTAKSLAEVVEKSADINTLVTINGKELTQLMVACYCGNIDFVENLLADPRIKADLRNDEGKHALICACEEGHVQIVQLILDRNLAPPPSSSVICEETRANQEPDSVGELPDPANDHSLMGYW